MIEVGAQDLAKALDAVDVAMSKKPQMRILTNVLIECVNKSTLKVTGTDTFMGAGVRVPAAVEKIPPCAVDFARLRHVAASFPSDVVLKLKDNPTTLEVRAKRSKYQIPKLEATEFPKLPKPPTEHHQVDAEVLLDLVKTVEHAMLDDDDRPHLSGALFTWAKSGVQVDTTDGRRAAHVVDSRSKDTWQLFLTRRAMGALRKLCSTSEGDITLASTDRMVFMWSATTGYNVRLPHVPKYVEYHKLWPTKDAAVTCTVSPTEISQAIRRLSLQPTDVVKVSSYKTGLQLELSDAQTGQGVERIPAKLSAKVDPIHLGANDLAEACDALGMAEAELGFWTAREPVRLAQANARMLVMARSPA